MSKELTKERFIDRLKSRGKYLYKEMLLSTPNDNYVDYACDYILENEIVEIDGEYALKGVEQISKKSSYNPEHKKALLKKVNRGEDPIIYDMFYRNKDKQNVFGKLIEYQIPLYEKPADKDIGMIDLVCEKRGVFYMVEVKSSYSMESLLKAILEIQTYYQIADREKLLQDFSYDKQKRLKKVIAIFKGTYAEKQYLNNKKIKKIANMLGIKIMVLEDSGKDGLTEIKY